MRKSEIMKIGIFGIMAASLLTGCIKDDTQELKDQEMRLLQQDLDRNNITAVPSTSGLYYLPIGCSHGGSGPKIRGTADG